VYCVQKTTTGIMHGLAAGIAAPFLAAERPGSAAGAAQETVYRARA
jgi:hypothetical protein